MFQLKVDAKFSAAHALRGYQGKCENLHGHNYKVRLTVEGDALDPIGMVCDFKKLKLWLKDALNRLDHQYLNDLESFRETNPSAEVLARSIFRDLAEQIAGSTNGMAILKSVRVWETEGCSATYML